MGGTVEAYGVRVTLEDGVWLPLPPEPRAPRYAQGVDTRMESAQSLADWLNVTHGRRWRPADNMSAADAEWVRAKVEDAARSVSGTVVALPEREETPDVLH